LSRYFTSAGVASIAFVPTAVPHCSNLTAGEAGLVCSLPCSSGGTANAHDFIHHIVVFPPTPHPTTTTTTTIPCKLLISHLVGHGDGAYVVSKEVELFALPRPFFQGKD
jgi:hypothetical protein